MLELFIAFGFGCAVGYAAREMLSRYRRERERQRRGALTMPGGGGDWVLYYYCGSSITAKHPAR